MELMDLGRSFAALLFVLVLIGAVALLAKRYLPQAQSGIRAGKKRMQILETMPLDPRNRLVLIELDGCELLIGLGQNGPVLLKAVGDLDTDGSPTIERTGEP